MKKFLAMLLALVMTLALVACGGGNNNSQDNNSAPADNTQTDAQTPADDTQAPADDAQAPSGDAVTIKIGGIGPITGDLAQYGTATEWGAEIAVAEINALNGPVKLE